MEQYIDFITRHWELGTAFVVLLILVIAFEIRHKLTGIPQLSPQQATLLMNREDAVMLDLRDKPSFIKGHVLNAVNVPLLELNDKPKQLEKYKNNSIIVVSNPGQALNKIGPVLQKQGFTKIYNLSGGINAWQSAGLPLTKN